MSYDDRSYKLNKYTCLNEYNYFLMKMVVFGKIDWNDFDMEYGKYYKIPICCIKNFIEICEQGEAPYLFMSKKYGEDDKQITYVRCLKCRGIK